MIEYGVTSGIGMHNTHYTVPDRPVTKADIDKQYVSDPKHVPIQLTTMNSMLFIGCSCGAVLHGSVTSYSRIWEKHRYG